MSQRRKVTHRKSSTAEDIPWENFESTRASAGPSTRRPIYPNVPKRRQRELSICQDDSSPAVIQTESRIYILPPLAVANSIDECPSPMSSPANGNASMGHSLDRISKYTLPQEILAEVDEWRGSPSSADGGTRHRASSSSQPMHRSTSKRSLSPPDELNVNVGDSKRTKSSEDDDDELSQLLDHRQSKHSLSQGSLTSISTQASMDNEPRKATLRKPTIRKLNATQQKPSISPTEAMAIELTDGRDNGGGALKCSSMTNITHQEFDDRHDQMISPLPLIVDHPTGSSDSTSQRQIPTSPIIRSSLSTMLKSTPGHPFDMSSPCYDIRERRCSSTSSASLCFETPRSSLSRTTTGHTILTSPTAMKVDAETQVTFLSHMDMMARLISQTHLHHEGHQTHIDHCPTELAKKLFYQCNSLASSAAYEAQGALIKHQSLRIGRYEIDIPFPADNDRSPTIYACDLCLKHFHGSAMAAQRHASKCLSTQPPGQLVFHENDLAIFQIGETHMNITQRLYVKSLIRVARLFIDGNRSLDETKIDRFAYYILCRRDTVLSPSQTYLYRLVGYFSKQLNQHAQQPITNLSCLFVLPSFARHQSYSQLLIAFSYYLMRSISSYTIVHGSPARPLDVVTLAALRTYWQDTLLTCLREDKYRDADTITLDTLARETSIHPRDILFTLHSNRFIVPHPTDKSSVYLLERAHQSPSAVHRLDIKHELLLVDMKPTDGDPPTNVMFAQQSLEKMNASVIEEIVLD